LTKDGVKKSRRYYYNGFVSVFDVKFENAISAETYTVKCTGNHRFFSPNRGWIEVQDIAAGMMFTNNWFSESVEESSEKIHTYDIEVDDVHSYILENGIVSHNTTSLIMGNISPSIEAIKANVYRQDTMSGAFIHRNRQLHNLLLTKNVDVESIWSEIIANDGSVQKLKCLTIEEKEVYKTAIEIDQRWVIEHASDRQTFIDQSQSVNLFFRPDVDIKYLHAVHFLAWKQKLKTLYYCRSEKIRKADKVSQKIERKRLDEIDLTSIIAGTGGCLACE